MVRKGVAVIIILSVLLVPLALALPLLGSGEIYGTVTDNKSLPLDGVKVSLNFRANQTLANTTYTDASGRYSFKNLSADNYTLKFSLDNYQDKFVNVTLTAGEKHELNVVLQRTSGGGADNAPSPSKGADSTIIILFPLLFVLAAVVVAVGLYSKLKKDRVLDHKVRERIYTYIRENPGSHYRGMLEALGLKMGVLTHHLRTLEREEFIRSVQNGVYRRYYPSGMNIDIAPPLSETQQRLLQIVRQNPGISQTEIATLVDERRMYVNYHIKRLRDYGLVAVQVDGRVSACYVNPQSPVCEAPG